MKTKTLLLVLLCSFAFKQVVKAQNEISLDSLESLCSNYTTQTFETTILKMGYSFWYTEGKSKFYRYDYPKNADNRSYISRVKTSDMPKLHCILCFSTISKNYYLSVVKKMDVKNYKFISEKKSTDPSQGDLVMYGNGKFFLRIIQQNVNNVTYYHFQIWNV